VPMPVTASLLEAARDNRHEAIEMLTNWGFSDRARLGGNPNPGNWMVSAGMRLMERAAPGVIHADLTACNEYATGLKDAAAVRCAALLILGERDRLTPVRSARELTRALPNAETAILLGCGHAMLAEQPEQVLDQLIRVV
jgi:pimeloyl-ACP methyl ester carboxylesterase